MAGNEPLLPVAPAFAEFAELQSLGVRARLVRREGGTIFGRAVAL